jgi:quercetin dioxygenase-like cupin family protein
MQGTAKGGGVRKVKHFGKPAGGIGALASAGLALAGLAFAILVSAGLALVGSRSAAEERLAGTDIPPVIVTQLLSTAVTSSGQPIVMPQKDVQIVVSHFDVAPGATLPEHKHPFPRYGYVEAGTLRVTNLETGKTETYGPGSFIVESVGQWHRAENAGVGPIRLLVIDVVEKGTKNTIVKN